MYRDSSNDEPPYITYICCGCDTAFHSKKLPWHEFHYCSNCLDPSKSVVVTRPIPIAAESFSDLVEAKYLKYKPCIEGADKKYPRYEHAFTRLCQLMFPLYNVQKHIADKTKTLSRARDAAAKHGLDFPQITYLLADAYLHSRAVETVIMELLQEQRLHEAKAHEAAEDVAPIYSHTMEAYNYKNYIMALFEQGVGWDGTKLDGPKDDPSEDENPDKLALIG